MTEQGWLRLLRGAAFAGGLVAMYVSAQFSVSGFSIDKPDLIWIGWFLAFLIVITEFTWRKPGMEDNMTMAIVGISAYTFGIVTNVRGIMMAMGITDWQNELWSVGIAIITGVFLEVMPEPFFSWGLTGRSMADMFGEVRTMVNGDARPIPGYKPQQPTMRFAEPRQGSIQPEIMAQLEKRRHEQQNPEFEMEREPEFAGMGRGGNHNSNHPTTPLNQQRPSQGGGQPKNRNQFPGKPHK